MRTGSRKDYKNLSLSSILLRSTWTAQTASDNIHALRSNQAFRYQAFRKRDRISSPALPALGL